MEKRYCVIRRRSGLDAVGETARCERPSKNLSGRFIARNPEAVLLRPRAVRIRCSPCLIDLRTDRGIVRQRFQLRQVTTEHLVASRAKRRFLILL